VSRRLVLPICLDELVHGGTIPRNLSCRRVARMLVGRVMLTAWLFLVVGAKEE